MALTIFSTPIITPILRYIARLSMRLSGWQIIEKAPLLKQYVLIAAPHTTNWDLAVLLAAVLDSHSEVHWMGKKSLFPKPFRGFMRWLGGIAVDRSKNQNMVSVSIAGYKQSSKWVLAIPPEGTRNKTERWKSGFYHIAVGAGVPIQLGWVDFAKKQIGYGETFYPSGNYEQDIKKIQAFYTGRVGKYEDKF